MASLAASPAPPLPIAPGIVRTVARGGATVIVLSGEHDIATLEPVRAALTAAVSRGLPMTIDLSRCAFIDCAIARALAGAGPAGRHIIVGAETPAIVRRLLDLLAVPFREVSSRETATSHVPRRQ